MPGDVHLGRVITGWSPPARIDWKTAARSQPAQPLLTEVTIVPMATGSTELQVPMSSMLGLSHTSRGSRHHQHSTGDGATQYCPHDRRRIAAGLSLYGGEDGVLFGSAECCNRRAVGGAGDAQGRPSGLGPEERDFDRADGSARYPPLRAGVRSHSPTW